MKKLLILSALLLFVLPGTAQATTMQDSDDVGPGMLDIRSASVGHTDVEGDRVIVLTVESYEPFGCSDLAGARRTGNSLTFDIDYPSTIQRPDLRFRIRCLASGDYRWRARLLGTEPGGVVVLRGTATRPTETTLTVRFTGEEYNSGAYGEEPARWKVVSARWLDSQPAEVDTAPDHGWAVFDSHV